MLLSIALISFLIWKKIKTVKEFLLEDVPQAAYIFTIEQFQQDFIHVGKLFWNSDQNFHINDKFEEVYLKDGKRLEENIFSFYDKKNIDPVRILQLVKKDFGVDDSQIEATENEKIILKLFYISYTCNELISMLCGKINEDGFKYKSIYNFYYIVSKLYNNAINGFMNIKEDFEKEKKNESMLESFIKGDAAPNL